MSGAQKLLGDSLLGKDGKVQTESLLGGGGKVVGLYFSAHWCPPCRGFTPTLASWYKKSKELEARKCLEMVFVSSDRDQVMLYHHYNFSFYN